jgi:hypothetical protein
MFRVDPKINYLAKINYYVRARFGRPKNDGSIPRNVSSWLEFRVSNESKILSDIHELKARHQVRSVQTLASLRNVFPRINRLYGLESLFLVTFHYLSFLVVPWACLAGKVCPPSEDYGLNW